MLVSSASVRRRHSVDWPWEDSLTEPATEGLLVPGAGRTHAPTDGEQRETSSRRLRREGAATRGKPMPQIADSLAEPRLAGVGQIRVLSSKGGVERNEVRPGVLSSSELRADEREAS